MTGKLTLELDLDDPRVPGVAAALAGLPSTPTPVVIPPVVTPPVIQPSASYRVLTMADAAPCTAGVWSSDPAKPSIPPGDLHIGTGKHQIKVKVGTAVGAEVYTNPPQTPEVFDVWVTSKSTGRHLVGQSITASGFGGWQGGMMDTVQNVILSGDWDDDIISVDLVYDKAAYYTTFLNLTFDGQVMDSALYRDVFATVGQLTGSSWMLPANLPPPTVAGATAGTTVPVVAASGELAKLIPVGTLPAQTIKDAAAISADLVGSGIDKTIIDVTGIAIAHGKGALVPTAHCKISQLTIKGASCSDNNGAGVRDDGPGIGFDLDNVKITGCQDGVLTFNGDSRGYNFTNCIFDGNGAGDGQSHNIYIGAIGPNGHDPNCKFTLTNSVSINPKGGHAVKSRAGSTIASGNTVSATDGALYDISEGGVFTASNEIWSKPAGSGDHKILSYAPESAANGAAGVTLTNIELDNPDGTGFILMGVSAPITFVNCTVKAGQAIPTIAWVNGATPGTVTGAFTQGKAA